MVRASSLTTVCLAVALLGAPPLARAQPSGLGATILCGYNLKKTGCDTRYENAVKATRIDETTWRVTASGNGMTKASDVYDFMMRKAAESTMEAGYDVFILVAQTDTTRHITGVSGGGDDGIGGVNAISSYDIVRPGQAVTVKMLKGPKPATEPNAYDAREVLKFMTPATPAKR
jgi:hypothetical protein